MSGLQFFELKLIAMLESPNLGYLGPLKLRE